MTGRMTTDTLMPANVRATGRVPRRIAVLSLHTSPLAPLGGRETGGMNVYVREVSARLAALGIAVDVFTRRIDEDTPDIEEFAPRARLIQIEAGPRERLEKEALPPLTDEFADEVLAFAEHEASQYDLVHSHYWLSAAAGERLSERWGIPHVGMFHTLAEVKLQARASEHESQIRRDTERGLIERLDHIVAATRHEQRLLRQLYGASEDRVSVIPLGVDVDCFRPRDQEAARRELGLDHLDRILLAVGRIEPLKGLDILIRSLAEMTELEHVTLIVVGGDERSETEIERLRAEAVEAGVEARVRFLGSVAHSELPTYYNAADVVVVPSFYESFGLVAVEAMASGVPVVASRVGGLTATITDGRTGYLVPWRCPGPFAEKLDLLLRNEGLRMALGSAAAEAMRSYEWGAVADRLVALYSELIDASRVNEQLAAHAV